MYSASDIIHISRRIFKFFLSVFIGLIRCSAVYSDVLPEFISMMQFFLVRVLNIFFKNVTILLENRGIPAAFAR